MSIVDGIARLLAAAGVGAYDPDNPLPAGQTPITVGAMPPSNGAAVCVTTYPGGPEPDTRTGDEYPRLQVRVRHRDPLAALDLDRAAYEALRFTTGGPNTPGPLPGAESWWLQDCYALQSEAQPMGVDANGRHEYARNYQLTCRPTS